MLAASEPRLAPQVQFIDIKAKIAELIQKGVSNKARENIRTFFLKIPTTVLEIVLQENKVLIRGKKRSLTELIVERMSNKETDGGPHMIFLRGLLTSKNFEDALLTKRVSLVDIDLSHRLLRDSVCHFIDFGTPLDRKLLRSFLSIMDTSSSYILFTLKWGHRFEQFQKKECFGKLLYVIFTEASCYNQLCHAIWQNSPNISNANIEVQNFFVNAVNLFTAFGYEDYLHDIGWSEDNHQNRDLKMRKIIYDLLKVFAQWGRKHPERVRIFFGETKRMLLDPFFSDGVSCPADELFSEVVNYHFTVFYESLSVTQNALRVSTTPRPAAVDSQSQVANQEGFFKRKFSNDASTSGEDPDQYKLLKENIDRYNHGSLKTT